MSVPDAELPEMVKQPIEIPDPQNQNDDYQSVQDRFDLSLHGNKPVYEPQNNPYCDNCDDYGGKRHFIFSDQFLAHDTREERAPCFVHARQRRLTNTHDRWTGLAWDGTRKRRTITPLPFLLFQADGKISEL
jgi:hypothetical protein